MARVHELPGRGWLSTKDTVEPALRFTTQSSGTCSTREATSAWVEGKTTCVTSDEELKERLDELVALIRAEAEVGGRVDRVQSHYLYYLMSVPYKGTVRHLNSKTFASDDGPVNYHSAIFLPGIAPEEAEDEEEAVDEEEEDDEEEVTVGLRRGSQSERE
eukprot:gene2504-5461_t